MGRLGATTEERVAAAATALCVLLGLWLRARGFFYDAPAFWVDECAWAVYVMEQPLVDLLIRPPGFMAVSKLAAVLFGPTEAALRALPWCAGVAATLFAPFLARRLFSAPAARILFVAIIALHPSAISFAKEYKPYEVSMTLHLALVLLALRYVATRTARDLAWLLALAFLGGPFAQDLVFAYPGIFLVAGYDAFRHRRRHIPAIALTAAAILGVLALQYVLIWSRITEQDSEFWGNKYNVFYGARSRSSYLGWFFDRYQGIATFPGYHRTYWDADWLSESAWSALQGIAVAIWLVIHFVGVASMLLRRRFRELLLLLLPIGVVWVFNAARIWPFGLFRANLFMLGYSAAIAAMSFDRPSLRWPAVRALIPASVLILIPIFWFENGWGPTKRALTYTSQFPEVVVWLSEQPYAKGRPPATLLIDRKSCDPWRYYVEFNPTTSRLRRKLERAYRARCIDSDGRLGDAVMSALDTEERPLWLLFNIRTRTKPVIASVKDRAEIVSRATRGRHTAIALGNAPRKGRDAAPPHP